MPRRVLHDSPDPCVDPIQTSPRRSITRSTDAVGAADGSLWLDALSSGDAARTNVGVVETAGESGTATVTLIDPLSRAVLDTRTFALAPFTHVQFPLPRLRDSAPKLAEVRVSGGHARR